MKLVKRLVGIALFFGALYLGIRFAQDNDAMISLNLPFGWVTYDVELWAMVIISGAAGAVLATVVFLAQILGAELGKRKLSRRVKSLERELNDLRNMSLAPEKTPETLETPKPSEENPSGAVAQPWDAPST